MLQPSGPAWCDKFPTSVSLDDLAKPFQDGARRFLEALKAAGASVIVAATYRPMERAYLIHWCCEIAGYRNKATGHWSQSDPSLAQGAAAEALGIDWTHAGDRKAAIEAAREMVDVFGIAYPAALVSRHTQRLAIDMSVRWAGIVQVVDARGVSHDCAAQEDLWPIGASYGVHKLPSDAPHWSSDGR